MRTPDSRAAGVGAKVEEVHVPEMRAEGDEVEYDGRTKLSRVCVYRRGRVRCLSFVWEKEDLEAVQSCIDLSRPWELQTEYLRQMVQCRHLVPDPRRILLIGLGGGSLVHYYRASAPLAQIDVVEVDAGIIWLANHFFGVRSGGPVRIMEADACGFVRQWSGEPYDVAHVDAFQKRSPGTSKTGEVLCVREPAFLSAMKRCLRVGGTVSYNCHDAESVAAIRREFPTSFVLPAPGAQVVIGVRGAW